MDRFSKVNSRLANPWPFRPQSPSGTNLFTAVGAEHEDGPEHGAEHADASLTIRPPTFNVVLFGDIGAGKSSVINLIARKSIAHISSDVNGAAMQFTRYDIPIDGMNFAIFDTIGLEDPEMGVNGYLKAIEKAYWLIMRLSAAGGIHLLLFCMRGGRITAVTQSNYRLFHECLCHIMVPIVLVFTGLEREMEMENWWERNERSIRGYGFESNGHACITSVRDDIPGEDLKFTESQIRVRKLLKDCVLKDEGFSPDSHYWFTGFGGELKSFIAKKKIPKKRDVVKVLTRRCKLDPETASKIAEMMDASDVRMVSVPYGVLVKWTNTMLAQSSVDGTLRMADKTRVPLYLAYRAICDVLEQDGHITEAIRYFGQMTKVLTEMGSRDEQAQWVNSFQQRCAEKLQFLADVATGDKKYDQAVEHFSAMLSLDRVDRSVILLERSKAKASMNAWSAALSDADEAIRLDPSSHRGYESRHAALRGARRHAEAIEAFDTMLLKIDQSPYEHVRILRSQYTDAKPTIRCVITETLHDMPRVLIDTTTGQLCDKKQQAAAFEALPVFKELAYSMKTGLEIRGAVKEFFRYVMLSHTWEEEEPLMQRVKNSSIYKLEKSSRTNIKVQEFCSLVRLLGIRWAWVDTTCVDQENNVILQESLVAMFTWYRGSSLTVIYLRDVSSESLPGSLRKSIWNTRGWTYQEYVAAETVQFYTGDWKPYLGLDPDNHKKSPAIISEMQQATGISAPEMEVLKPGLDRVREKLYVASMRQTTRREDVAYSLLGIFNVAIPVIYGEGDRAVGRLLEHILTGSGDVSILAWTGRAGSYNSCLPVDLTVYSQLIPSHIPQNIEADKMDSVVTAFHPHLPDPSLVTELHNLLRALPPPSLASSRLRLPGIVYSLSDLHRVPSADPVTNVCIYRATTPLFRDIEIHTTDNLSGMDGLCLIHPWIRPLLEQGLPRHASAQVRMTHALRLLARLRQPFGALLLQPLSMSGIEYKRVAADSLIMVQIREDAPLSEIIDSIDTVEIQ